MPQMPRHPVGPRRPSIGYRVKMKSKDATLFESLADITPTRARATMLIVGKRPAHISVRKGHYLQGRHGRMLWKLMKTYGLLSVPVGHPEDDYLILHGYGLTDLVKRPGDPGNEPTDDEYGGKQAARPAPSENSA
jgi:hypothetical protein